LEFLCSDFEELEDVVPLTLQEAEGSVGLMLDVLEEEENFLQSKLIPNDIMDNYKHTTVKLMRELEAMDFVDYV